MSDMAEVFDAMKEIGKMHRAESQTKNTELLPALQELGKKHGLRIDQKSDHHWNVYRGEECLAQFWPTKNKFQNTKTGKVTHGTGLDMMNHVIRRL